jgi:superfamily II DNA helicase RecQ
MLQQLLKDEKVDWTCVKQRDAVTTAMDYQDVLVIIKTRAGKTMIPLIPAMLEKDKTTVIVLPLKSLIEDYVEKLERMVVPFEHFNGAPHLWGLTNIILVSADIFWFSPWKQTAGELHQRKPIYHVCFDEGHFVFTGDDFSKLALGSLYKLCMFECTQVLAMSAMVMEVSVPYLLNVFMLTNTICIFHTPTTHPEIRYVLEKLCTKDGIMSRMFDIAHSHH